jgi:ATPase subunit of ABC transporter with duplicated ATPase domains
MSFRYRDWVLREVSDSVCATKVGLVGPNGCGKTTLLRLIDGELTPQHGSIAVQGTTYMVGFDLTAYKSFWPDDIVDLCSHLASFDTSRADGLFDALHFAEYRHTPIGELSKGTAKKVSLLMGFMSTADLLLVDEPFESIDAESNDNVVRLLQERSGSHLIVSHDREVLRRCVDVVYTIADKELERLDG